MIEWIVEEGVGETRAALVEHGAIVAARIERDGETLRHGAVAEARVGAPATGGRTRVVIAGRQAVLRGAAGASEGSRIRVTVVREAIPEENNPKPPEVRLARPDETIGMGPTLAERIAGGDIPFRRLQPHQPDDLENAGWSEAIEAARTGLVAFDQGLLRISLTPAMTVIDVDGGVAAADLAIAGAAAAARAIRLLGIGGSIGVDLPTVADKAIRQRAARALDAHLPPPFERTAVNGFGFVQIVRPRLRPSLAELIRSDPVTAASLALLRAAERARIAGGVTLVVAPSVVARIDCESAWTAELTRRLGAPVALRAERGLAISAGYAETFIRN